MGMCMGDYICNLPIALLTQKRKASGAASPEMAVTKGKRLCVMQEPDVNETLNVGQMKEITGNDKIQARGLYKEPFEFTPQFKLIMMCNDLPNIPSNDDGTWRRIEAVDFVARFIDDPDDISEEQHRYMKDKNIKKKIPMWVIPFYSLLLPQWRLYDKEGIEVPDEVNAKTNSYRNESDIVGQWITEQCETIDNEIAADGITESAPSELKYLYSEFKDWCEDEDFAKNVIPEKNKFRDALKKWQSKSKYGLKIGKKGEKYPNGNESNLKFNLKVC
jgi:P4 family phage/plasmid primase-like protien